MAINEFCLERVDINRYGVLSTNSIVHARSAGFLEGVDGRDVVVYWRCGGGKYGSN